MIKNLDAVVPAKAGVKHGCNYRQDIEDFLAAGKKAAEICVPNGGDAKSIVGGYRAAIRRRDEFHGAVGVQRRGDRVFLVRLNGE